MTPTVPELFSQRLAYWSNQGLFGAALYERLANDDALPVSLKPDEWAEILGVRPTALKKQRNRGTGAPFIRVTDRAVRYPRPSSCRHLAERFVDPKGREAA